MLGVPAQGAAGPPALGLSAPTIMRAANVLLAPCPRPLQALAWLVDDLEAHEEQAHHKLFFFFASGPPPPPPLTHTQPAGPHHHP
jgi:hypothetical protein